MIFNFLHRHLPPWFATVLAGMIYAGLLAALWVRSSVPAGAFRYAGL